MSRNLISYWLAFVFVAATSFFMSPFVVHHLGNTSYGVWTLLSSLVGYLGLLDFGIRTTVTRYVAQYHAVGASEKSSSIVSAAMLMFGILGIVAIVVACLISRIAPYIFNIPTEYLGQTQAILVIGGITVAVTLVGAVFGGIVAGLQRFDVSSGIEIIITLLRTMAVLIALTKGFGLVTLALIHLASSAFQGIASWYASRVLYPEIRLNFKGEQRPYIRTILSFSLLLSAMHMSGVLINYSDAIIIAAFLPVSAVTYFAISASLCDYARQAASALSMLMTPRVSALQSLGSGMLNDEILSAARIATFITAPIGGIFFIRGESFINLWMGHDYGGPSGEILRILALAVIFGGARGVASASIVGLNKHRTLVPILGVEAICNIVLSVVLVKPLGLNGVALGTLLPSLIAGLGYVPHCLSRATGISRRRFYSRAWLLPMVACMPYIGLNVFFERLYPTDSLVIFFLQVVLTLPLVFLGAIVFCFSSEERRRLGAIGTRLHKHMVGRVE